MIQVGAVKSKQLGVKVFNQYLEGMKLFDIMCVCLSGLIRNIQFFGIESQKKVTGSYVVVIGLGGVGSHAASMLLRSGVGRLLLVDFDQVPSECLQVCLARYFSVYFVHFNTKYCITRVHYFIVFIFFLLLFGFFTSLQQFWF